jgi:hypothetical protein
MEIDGNYPGAVAQIIDLQMEIIEKWVLKILAAGSDMECR